MVTVTAPSCENDLAAIAVDAIGRGARLSIVGGGSKAAVGRPTDAEPLAMSGMAGIVDYDPPELVLTVRAGTPLAQVQALVESERQMLAFEPFDHGPIFGSTAAKATIGGVVAAGVSGSRRLSAGGARDHVLGLRAVSGRGEVFVAGAKVVKNVTGYDLPKLAAGSWGRLFAITELTLKVMPRPETAASVMIEGLTPDRAVRAMAAAMRSQAEVAAAAHVPAASGRSSITAFRLEGCGPSVAARCAMLRAALRDFAAPDLMDDAAGAAFWDDLRTLKPLGEGPLWRINVPPSGGLAMAEAFAPLGADWMMDWAGGLVWLAFDGEAAVVRQAAAAAGGHATLVRAPETIRAHTPAFHPPERALAALEERIRRAFDPAGLFETGRF